MLGKDVQAWGMRCWRQGERSLENRPALRGGKNHPTGASLASARAHRVARLSAEFSINSRRKTFGEGCGFGFAFWFGLWFGLWFVIL